MEPVCLTLVLQLVLGQPLRWRRHALGGRSLVRCSQRLLCGHVWHTRAHEQKLCEFMRFDTQIRAHTTRSRHVPCCLAHTTSFRLAIHQPFVGLRAKHGNAQCFECGAHNPAWASPRCAHTYFLCSFFCARFFSCHTFAEKLLQAAAPQPLFTPSYAGVWRAPGLKLAH